MEKRNIDMSKYADMHEEKTVKGKDGTEITVRDHIPYKDKEAMAMEMINHSVVSHGDACLYVGYGFDKIKLYMIAKYYTDIDITDDIDIDTVANYLINNEMLEEIIHIITYDLDYVIDMYWQIFDAISTTAEDDGSIRKALRTSFGFLFTGEDVTESLAKAEAMKDTVYNAIGALRKVEKEKEENIDNGTLMVGGNVINFAKKRE